MSKTDLEAAAANYRAIRDFAETNEQLKKAKAGCPVARQALFDDLVPDLRRLIRGKLPKPLRRLHDSSDFLQQTRLALHRRGLGEDIFDSPDKFWAFFSKVLENQILAAQRKYLEAQKRNVMREVPIDQLTEQQRNRLVSKEPSQEQHCQANDTFRFIDRRLETTVERLAFRLLRLEYPIREIARLLNVCERTVERIRERIAEIAWEIGKRERDSVR
jgi:RNA polymerase sigma factor (sigma-70 family)